MVHLIYCREQGTEITDVRLYLTYLKLKVLTNNNGGNMNTEQVILNLAFIGAVLSILTILNAFSGGMLW